MAGAGSVQLKELGLKLKAAGDPNGNGRAGGLRRQLLAGIRLGAAPLVGDVRAAALERLPHRGGLAALVASSPIAIRTRLTGVVGVRIVNTHQGGRTSGTTEFGTDRGHVRHPVFGRKGPWVGQNVPPGWFSKTLEEKAPETEAFVLAAMNTVATEVCNL
jgi:hypothetical protein